MSQSTLILIMLGLVSLAVIFSIIISKRNEKKNRFYETKDNDWFDDFIDCLPDFGSSGHSDSSSGDCGHSDSGDCDGGGCGSD